MSPISSLSLAKSKSLHQPFSPLQPYTPSLSLSLLQTPLSHLPLLATSFELPYSPRQTTVYLRLPFPILIPMIPSHARPQLISALPVSSVMVTTVSMALAPAPAPPTTSTTKVVPSLTMVYASQSGLTPTQSVAAPLDALSKLAARAKSLRSPLSPRASRTCAQTPQWTGLTPLCLPERVHARVRVAPGQQRRRTARPRGKELSARATLRLPALSDMARERARYFCLVTPCFGYHMRSVSRSPVSCPTCCRN